MEGETGDSLGVIVQVFKAVNSKRLYLRQGGSQGLTLKVVL